MEAISYLVTVKKIDVNLKNAEGRTIAHILFSTHSWIDPIETLILLSEKAPSLNLQAVDNYGKDFVRHSNKCRLHSIALCCH
jgi:hypothetical protein